MFCRECHTLIPQCSLISPIWDSFHKPSLGAKWLNFIQICWVMLLKSVQSEAECQLIFFWASQMLHIPSELKTEQHTAAAPQRTGKTLINTECPTRIESLELRRILVKFKKIHCVLLFQIWTVIHHMRNLAAE